MATSSIFLRRIHPTPPGRTSRARLSAERAKYRLPVWLTGGEAQLPDDARKWQLADWQIFGVAAPTKTLLSPCWNRQTVASHLATALLIASRRTAAHSHSAGLIDVLQMFTRSLLLCAELTLNEGCYDTLQTSETQLKVIDGRG